MESDNAKQILLARARLKCLIGQEHISNYNPMAMQNAEENVYRLSNLDTNLGRKVKSTLLVIEEAFKRYRSQEIVVAFTGGKDCTVLLHLIYAYYKRHCTHSSSSSMIRALFVRTRPSFCEVEEFIRSSLRNYEIIPPRSNFIEYNGAMKESLWRLNKEYPELKAVFMGTKETDPNGKQQSFNDTTSGWPNYCLINPIIDWSYGEVWQFLRDMTVPYCSLYDKGYTSLGGMDNTLPNQKLLYIDNDGTARYRPAYCLQDNNSERIGRQSNNNT